jgi:hypothetical protein
LGGTYIQVGSSGEEKTFPQLAGNLTSVVQLLFWSLRYIYKYAIMLDFSETYFMVLNCAV